MNKRPKIFYGWYILTVGMLGSFVAVGFSQLFMSIMLKPLVAEFGWSRTAATGVITAGTILSGLLSFPFGRLVDRHGPRMLTAVGALITAAMYFCMTQFFALWEYYAVFLVGRVVSTNALSSIVPRTAAVNWFRRLRGRALGLLAMATPLGASCLAICAQLVMVHYGWRSVFLLLALGTIILQAIPAALVLRRCPEDCGLLPDGDREPESTRADQRTGHAEFSWTLDEAMRTTALWLLIVSSIIALIVNAGVGFHLVAYYTDVGISDTAAAGAISVYAFTGAIANVAWGFLSEKISERLLAAVVMLMTAASILYLLTVSAVPEAMVFAALFGLTSRGESTLVGIILAQYYGRGSYGSIGGFVNPFNMIGLGAGPLISSLMFDYTGSYEMIFSLFVVFSVVSAVLIWLAKKPAVPARVGASA